MENELKILLEETLKEHGIIKFDVAYVTKGCNVEIEIGENRNEQCGPLYEALNEWLGYGEFMDYLVSHDTFYNYTGEFYYKEEIFLAVSFIGPYCYDEDSSQSYINLEKEFITNVLQLDLSSFGMSDHYDKEVLGLDFFAEKGKEIENVRLNYFKGHWNQIELNSNQICKLKKFISTEINETLPYFYIDFDYELNWEVQCEENLLDFNFWTSPIKISLNDITTN